MICGGVVSRSFLGAEASINSDDGRARILLMGPRRYVVMGVWSITLALALTTTVWCGLALYNRSGKSSIQKVVFHKMSPHETLFLESTNDVRMKGTAPSI